MATEYSAHVAPIPAVPKMADCDLYRELIRRHGGDDPAAYHYAMRVRGRVMGHNGCGCCGMWMKMGERGKTEGRKS